MSAEKNLGSPEVRPPERKNFFGSQGCSPSRTEVFSAHWRARLLPSRDFGNSAIRQIGKSAGGQFGGLTVGSVGACLRRSLNFKTAVAHKGRRYKNFRRFQTSAHWRARLLPSRDFGNSANRQVGRWAGQQIGRWVGQDVGRKISAHQRFALQNGKILRLTRMFALQNESFLPHWRARLLPSRDFGNSAGRDVGRKISAHQRFALQNGRIIRLTWKFALQNGKIFSAHKGDFTTPRLSLPSRRHLQGSSSFR